MSSSCIEEVSVRDDNWFRIANELLSRAGIQVNGPSASDIQVKNPDFFKRVLQEGSLGLGKVIWTAGGNVTGWTCFLRKSCVPGWKNSSLAI
jgi:hypothetical protein